MIIGYWWSFWRHMETLGDILGTWVGSGQDVRSCCSPHMKYTSTTGNLGLRCSIRCCTWRRAGVPAKQSWVGFPCPSTDKGWELRRVCLRILRQQRIPTRGTKVIHQAWSLGWRCCCYTLAVLWTTHDSAIELKPSVQHGDPWYMVLSIPSSTNRDTLGVQHFLDGRADGVRCGVATCSQGRECATPERLLKQSLSVLRVPNIGEERVSKPCLLVKQWLVLTSWELQWCFLSWMFAD